MPEIVPRWEWRTFGESFGTIEERLGGLGVDKVQESDEVYLLSLHSNASVKFRAGVVDVKHLEHVNGDGLEQWKPVLKAADPMAAADVGLVLDELGVDKGALARDAYTFAQFLDEVIRPNHDLESVEVHKRRTHYTIDGCMAELSEVSTSGGTRRTLAIESENAAAVTAAVRDGGLGSRENVNLPRGLKALVGFDAHRYAVIDVGTNSVKFHIGARAADGTWTVVADRAVVTRLGQGLDDAGRLEPGPIERTVAAIAEMAEEARRAGVEEIAAVGTAGLRLAPNRDELIDLARERAGVDVEVISGEEEARLAYRAAVSALADEPGSATLVVFDTGGGSSQFTFGDGREIEEQFSVPVGAARFTERFDLGGIVPDDRLAVTRDAIASELATLDGRPTPDRLVGMGGAMTNLAAVDHRLTTYDPDVIQGTVLERAEVERQIELYRSSPADERRAIVGLQPNRAEVILAGACIVATVLDKLAVESVTVSDRGLRHGLLRERFGGV